MVHSCLLPLPLPLAVPIPPGNRRAFAHVLSPGGFVILSRRGDCAFVYPWATPRHLTHVLSKVPWVSLSGKLWRAFIEQWLVRQGLEKLADVFKGLFSKFYIFLHYL